MKHAAIFVVLAFVLAAGLFVPRHAADVTGSISAAMLPGGELPSCDQPLYLEEAELLSGGCG